MIFLYIYIFKL